ncbi:hypothetical protein JCM10369A_36660 [Nocardioides pyridinolyticus]
MIPINLFLVAWVWIGRFVFGVGGWFFLIFLFSVVPVVLVALLVTTILAYTQDGRPRSLTGFQSVAQLTTWLALLVFGTFCPDFGDTEESEMSVLTQVFGWSRTALDISYATAMAAALVALVAWIVLLGSLVFGRRRAPATMGT